MSRKPFKRGEALPLRSRRNLAPQISRRLIGHWRGGFQSGLNIPRASRRRGQSTFKLRTGITHKPDFSTITDGSGSFQIHDLSLGNILPPTRFFHGQSKFLNCLRLRFCRRQDTKTFLPLPRLRHFAVNMNTPVVVISPATMIFEFPTRFYA